MEICFGQEYIERLKALGFHKLEAMYGTEQDREWVEREEADLYQEADSFLPLHYLFERFECSGFQRHCVIMAFLWEIDYRFSEYFAKLQQEWNINYVTPFIAQKTWQRKISDMEIYLDLRENSVFMKVFFMEEELESVPEVIKKLQLNKQLLSFLLGDLSVIPWLKPWMRRELPDCKKESLHSSQVDVADLIGTGKTLVELYGAVGVGKKHCIRYYGNRKKSILCWFYLDKLLNSFDYLKEMTTAMLRECLIYDAMPVLVITGAVWEPGMNSLYSAVLDQLFSVLDLVFTVSLMRPVRVDFCSDVETVSCEIKDISLTEKRQAWRYEGNLYPLEAGLTIEDMANVSNLTYGQMKHALYLAGREADASGEKTVSHELLKKCCYSLFEQNVLKKAIRVETRFRWEDLILPQSQKKLISTACDQVRYRHRVYETWGLQAKRPYGCGVSMIFAGPPGTGKTMAASVVSNELGIMLYKVEISSVVSKFVGETEKNLEEIFYQAKQSRVLLFFDEADVLFSKRTEVKDANDKYSNMEAAFLLQKMEEYEGITILATNIIQNFDEAFKRRVKFVIDFPFPDKEARRNLWLSALLTCVPTEELDIEYLANRFELSGSNIKNIMEHALFLYASENEPGEKLSMKHIMLGIKNEFAKSGKILQGEDAGEYYPLIINN